ncbi:MAG: PhaM family polyhydroxyalkanoate granule multifunctional regulatory protein [Sterolibacterium sp.]
MTDSAQTQDPMEFLKSMWGGMGFPLPGMVTPTLDVDELDKRITDLKAVEGWLKMNLNMLQMSIQGLEMQRATIAAFQTMSQSSGSAEAQPNPFANPSMNPANWPWNFMQTTSAAEEPPPKKKPAAARKKKPQA